jgi:hypothetical protein
VCAGEVKTSAAADLRSDTTLASLALHKAEREEKKYEEIRRKVAAKQQQQGAPSQVGLTTETIQILK